MAAEQAETACTHPASVIKCLSSQLYFLGPAEVTSV